MPVGFVDSLIFKLNPQHQALRTKQQGLRQALTWVVCFCLVILLIAGFIEINGYYEPRTLKGASALAMLLFTLFWILETLHKPRIEAVWKDVTNLADNLHVPVESFFNEVRPEALQAYIARLVVEKTERLEQLRSDFLLIAPGDFSKALKSVVQCRIMQEEKELDLALEIARRLHLFIETPEDRRRSYDAMKNRMVQQET